jgi:hypothetical protein
VGTIILCLLFFSFYKREPFISSSSGRVPARTDAYQFGTAGNGVIFYLDIPTLYLVLPQHVTDCTKTTKCPLGGYQSLDRIIGPGLLSWSSRP